MISKTVGDAIRCVDDFQKSYTSNLNQEIYANVTLCGIPQPTLSWMIDDQVFNC